MAVDALGSISAGPLSLTVGETYTDNISSTSDVDYFKISSSEISVPSTATVTFTGLSTTTNNNEHNSDDTINIVVVVDTDIIAIVVIADYIMGRTL